MAEAYAQLAAEGYLHTSQGAPTRVARELITRAAQHSLALEGLHP